MSKLTPSSPIQVRTGCKLITLSLIIPVLSISLFPPTAHAESVIPTTTKSKTARTRTPPVRKEIPRTPLIAPGPLGLAGLLLSTLTGCASKSAGGSCYGVEYIPGGGGYPDQDFRDIRDRCRPDHATAWDAGTDGPALSSACEEAILRVLPLDTSLATSTTGQGPRIRTNLARAFHTLLFYPVADDGEIFGSASEFDYCQDVYHDFLGTTGFESSIGSGQTLTAAGYESGYAQMNLHLVRFILERTDNLRSVDLAEAGSGTVARAVGTDMEFTRNFADLSGAINLAGVIVHEARHMGEGFPDSSDHLECSSGEPGEICDDSMFGSYGAQLSYLDAVLRGSMRTTLEDGTPLLSKLDVMSTITSACTYYKGRINWLEGDLADRFAGDCGQIAEDTATGLGRTIPAWYGFEADDLSLR